VANTRLSASKKIFKSLADFDDSLRQKSGPAILGIDEAGRGPIAGPLVVAGVIFNQTPPFFLINDSKKLTPTQRELVFDKIFALARTVRYQVVPKTTIENCNIYRATVAAAEKIINIEKQQCDMVLLDALQINNSHPHQSIKKGDSTSLAIAAASIIAKVVRDRIMRLYARLYPEYLFEEHKGYPTSKHLNAIKKFGVLPIHRYTYNPIKSMLHYGKIKYYPQIHSQAPTSPASSA
jgi:ribonuclease HII